MASRAVRVKPSVALAPCARHDVRMFRTLVLLALMPVTLPCAALAEWAPRPSLFDFAATLDVCAALPERANLAAACAEKLAASFALKSAVARAAFICRPQNLASCAAPFEDEGLPAIAMRIATDMGCDATDVLALDPDAPLARDHCITIAADIMIDEGVVPLYTDIACGPRGTDCDPLADINAAFWVAQVARAAPDDPAILDLQQRNAADCGATGDGRDGHDALMCLADRSASLWADIRAQD